MGEIRALCISEKRGTQKHALDRVFFMTEHGIDGDAHAGDWHRQVSLLGLGEIDDFRARGADVDFGAFGENVVAEGFRFKELPLGTRLHVGDVFLEITQIGKECHSHCQIYHQVGDCIMPREGVFARGDRRLAPALYEAWRNGAKFDGWSDLFDDSRYFSAFKTCGVDWEYFSRRTRTIGEPLPWAHTSPGVLERFLKAEWQKALTASLTVDCRRTHCTGCGICPTLGVDIIDYEKSERERVLDTGTAAEENSALLPYEIGPKNLPVQRSLTVYRGMITKGEELRYVSHLDYANLFVRACKRAGLPMAYSEGFNPHMKVAFASALSLGAASDAEYVDFEMTEPLPTSEVMARLREHLPHGAQIVRLRIMEGKHRALMADVDEARYRIVVPYMGAAEPVRESVLRYNAAESAVWHRVTPKKSRAIETKDYSKTPVSFQMENGRLIFWMNIIVTPAGSVKPIEILSLMARDFALPIDPHEAYVTRTGLFADGKALIDR